MADLDDTLKRLADIELIDRKEISAIRSRAVQGPRFKPVTLRVRLSDSEIANFAIQRPRFPGVDFQPRLVRHYPNGESIAHALGYVGAVDISDLQRLDAAAYVATAHTGKTGIEYKFETDLHGSPGYRQVVTNARGRQIPTDTRELALSLDNNESPLPGANVYLSIYLDLQLLATA